MKHTALLLLVLVLGCASSGTRALESRSPFSNLSRQDLPDRTGQLLVYRNGNAYPVRLETISLFDCVNVRGGCQRDMPVHVELFPGQTHEVMIVYRARPAEPWSYRWSVRVQPLRG